MKTKTFLLLFFMLSFAFLKGQEVFRAELFFNNDTVKKGYAKMFIYNQDKVIHFKQNMEDPFTSIDANELKKIIYYSKNDTSEYHHLKGYLGIKQQKMSRDVWFKPVIKGYVTLYTIPVTMETSTGFGINHSSSFTFIDYYCIRSGEPAAKYISAVASINSNCVFLKYAPLYFADYPELAQKIRNKVYTYKDLETVVNEYNKWAESNKK
jgi:hypothetical protein